MTPVLRETTLCIVDPRRVAASSYSKHVPRGVCGHLLKQCQTHSFSGYLFVMHYMGCDIHTHAHAQEGL